MAVSSEQLSMVMYLKKFGEPRDADFISRMSQFEASAAQMKYIRDLYNNARIIHDPKYNPPHQAHSSRKDQVKSFSRTPDEEAAQHSEESRQGMLDKVENAGMMRVLMECQARAESGNRKYLDEFKNFAKMLAQLYSEGTAHEVRRQAKADFVATMTEMLAHSPAL